MPVKYVELDSGHGVQVLFENLERNEVAADVNHQAAPSETRPVVNDYRRNSEAFIGDVHQLQECFESAHDAESGRRIQSGVGTAYVQAIRFVLSQFLHCVSPALALEDQCGSRRVRY